MYHNEIYNDVNDALPDLLHRLERDGEEVGSRAGRTIELTHIGITLEQPCNREILQPGRKPNIAAQIAETMWVLAGKDDIGWLEHYLPRAREFSDDGIRWRAGYGNRLRFWPRRDESGDTIDQIRWVVDHLQEQPASRRAVLSIWDPVIDTVPGKDIPCNDWLSFSSRLGKLDLHVALRSNDIIWGWSGINQFEWSVLLEVVAGLLGLEVGSLHFSTTSFHIYDRHWNKSRKIREGAYRVTGLDPSPRFRFQSDFDAFDALLHSWFNIEKGIRHGDMMASEVEDFPEPMMQSWLRVLQWWWSGEREYLAALEGTRLERATEFSVQPPEREIVEVHAWGREEPIATAQVAPVQSTFATELCDLHDQKHAAYGDSWKRRGEMLGIMANIARKVDRLGGADTSDESSADTAGDLFVYLAKYRVWLDELNQGWISQNWGGSDDTMAANEVILDLDRKCEAENWLGEFAENKALEDNLRTRFNALEIAVREEDLQERTRMVNVMMHEAYVLARRLAEDVDEYRGADHD